MNFGGEATQPGTLGIDAPGAVLGICKHQGVVPKVRVLIETMTPSRLGTTETG